MPPGTPPFSACAPVRAARLRARSAMRRRAMSAARWTRYDARPLEAFSREREESSPVVRAAVSTPATSAPGAPIDPLDLYGVRAMLREEERMVEHSGARPGAPGGQRHPP